jgi:hypothetical protein
VLEAFAEALDEWRGGAHGHLAGFPPDKTAGVRQAA